MLAPGSRGTRVDFERGMAAAPFIILAIILANLVMFGWELAAGALTDEDTIVAAGALARERVNAGEYWRLVSATFLHAGFDHLLGNCLVLYIVGMACEHALGGPATAVVYFVSGVSGSLLSTMLSPGPSVGASGAVFGVTAAVIVTLWRYRHQFRIRDKRVSVVLVAWAVYQVVTGLMTPFIDNFAHIGGLLGGGLVALGIRPRLLADGGIV